MTDFYSDQMYKLDPTEGTGDIPESNEFKGRVRCQVAELKLDALKKEDGTTAGLTQTDKVFIGRIPAGARILYGILNPDAALGGTAELKIGLEKDGTTEDNSLRDTAIANAAGPELFGVVATDQDGFGVGEKLDAEADVILTNTDSTADLSQDAYVKVMIFYMID